MNIKMIVARWELLKVGFKTLTRLYNIESVSTRCPLMFKVGFNTLTTSSSIEMSIVVRHPLLEVGFKTLTTQRSNGSNPGVTSGGEASQLMLRSLAPPFGGTTDVQHRDEYSGLGPIIESGIQYPNAASEHRNGGYSGTTGGGEASRFLPVPRRSVRLVY
jgi:hypothetical protein